MRVGRFASIALAGLLFLTTAWSQPPLLTNEGILKLAKAGLGTEVIAAMVENQPGKYDVDTDAVIALKAAGVSDRVIAAMVVHTGRYSPRVPEILAVPQFTPVPSPPIPVPGPVATGPPPLPLIQERSPDDHGVYRPFTRVGNSMVQAPKMVYSGNAVGPVEFSGKNVCGGNFRITYVVGADGRVGDVSVVEGVHYVYQKGQISVVDGPDPGQVKSEVSRLQQQRFQPGTLDGTPVPVRLEGGGTQICHN